MPVTRIVEFIPRATADRHTTQVQRGVFRPRPEPVNTAVNFDVAEHNRSVGPSPVIEHREEHDVQIRLSVASTPLPENRGLCRRTATRTTRQALRYVPIRSDPCGRFSRGRASSKFCVASQEYQPVLDASDALSHALVKMSLIFWRPRVSNGASKELALGCYLHRAIHCWCRRA